MNIEDQPKISVVIRKRPLNKKEIQKNETDIVLVKNGETVIVSEYK
jgi:kinesin family protein 2/24